MKRTLLTMLAVMVCANLMGAVLLPAPSFAAVQNDIENQLKPIGDAYGNPNTDENSLSEAIASIIQIVLGFLGVIFIVLFVYAGILWMTSAGNEDKIGTAKSTMTAAIIGLAIVLSAYAITFFVIDQLLSATGVSDSGL